MTHTDLPALPVAQRERLPLAMQRASDKLARVPPDAAAERLLRQALSARTALHRVQLVQRAATAWSPRWTPWPPAARAVRCCHIPVTISRTEASMIGRVFGREPSRLVEVVQVDTLLYEAAVVSAEARLQAG